MSYPQPRSCASRLALARPGRAILLLTPLLAWAALGLAPSAPPTTRPLALPSLEDVKPVDYPGVHNVVAFGPGLYSGAVPEGDEGFQTLATLGFKTVLTVDGAAPEVERARKFGLRYVHLPITYAEITPERQLEIARAVRDLPKPLYLHCHHGKHRSAAAAGSAAVSLGLLTAEQAVDRMKAAGTAPAYKGLYACVSMGKVVEAARLAEADSSFPETSKVSDFTSAMVEIDEVFDRLKLIEKAGWQAPKDHPDLVPAAEAGRLVDLYRQSHAMNHPVTGPDRSTTELQAWFESAQKSASQLEEALVRKDKEAATKYMAQAARSCTDCHAKYRNVP